MIPINKAPFFIAKVSERQTPGKRFSLICAHLPPPRRSSPTRREHCLSITFGYRGLTNPGKYELGRTNGGWIKVKLTQQQKFVIGGYTLPEGNRKYFGSLPVGY